MKNFINPNAGYYITPSHVEEWLQGHCTLMDVYDDCYYRGMCCDIVSFEDSFYEIASHYTLEDEDYDERRD